MYSKLLAALLAITMLLGVSVCFAETAEAAYTPGTYQGTSKGAFGDIVLEVTLDETGIADVQVLEHAETYVVGGAAMESMCKDVVTHQTIALDTVSGATGTSMGFINAMKDAMKKANVDETAFRAPIPAIQYQDTEADLVVVGSGIAGLCAAVEAHEQGLNVILVEQMGILGGSSGFTGFLVGADTKAQKKANLTNTHEQVVERFHYQDKLLDPGLTNEDSIAYMIDQSGQTIDWLLDMGAQLWNVTWQDDIHHYANGENHLAGNTIVPTLHKRLDEEQMDYRLNTRATELLMDGDRVVGVRVKTKDGQSYDIRAKGVALCTGGYFTNHEMVEKYKPEFSSFTRTTGSKGADGSGMLMAAAAGAELAYMDQGSALPYMLIQRNGIPMVAPSGWMRGRGGILVNLEGKRISDENAPYYHTAMAAMAQTDGRSFAIMDQVSYDIDPQEHGLKEMLSNNYVTVADTIEELAEKMGIDKAGLLETVEHYGEMVRNGEDTDFGRKPAYMRTDFTHGPYYCVEVTPCMHTSFGGISIDSKAHALRADGTIVPGLYAAGECTVSHMQGVATNTFSAVFGRLVSRTLLEDQGIEAAK